jgi:wyosine [tRNA(Phe)-imidazoG37] synthetase (radical SAM superfamily)
MTITESQPSAGTAFGCPRDFWDHQFVYTVVSSRARGLSVGVNMNPDKHCKFDCVYCEVNRDDGELGETKLDIADMAKELEQTLAFVQSGEIAQQLHYRKLPAELLTLRHVALSGDGEPTLCSHFAEAVA